jgi:hypothetical protein
MDYAKILVDVVLPKLKQFGKPVTIKQQVALVGDWVKEFDAVQMGYIWRNTETGEISITEHTSSIVENTVDAIEDNFKKKDIDGEFVKAGDVKLYTTPNVTPDLGNIIVLNNKDYVVYHVEPIQPASLVLLYLVYARNINGSVQRT